LSGVAPVARRYRVRGRVQGVGFRAFVRNRAAALGLVGSVRNLPDGSVEVVAQGAAMALDRLGAQLAEGPAFSRVDGLEAASVPVDPSLEAFHITYPS